MLTDPVHAAQRETLMRVIAALLHFSPAESRDVQAAIINEAALASSSSFSNTFSSFMKENQVPTVNVDVRGSLSKTAP